MSDLVDLLSKGRIELFVILALTLTVAWLARQWRLAERENKDLQNARLEDAKTMLNLANEVKNSLDAVLRARGNP